MSNDLDLETGHGVNTPRDDTFTRRFILNFASSSAAVTASVGGATRVSARASISDNGRAAGFTNAVTLLEPLRPDSTPSLMAELDEIFQFGKSAAGGEGLIFSPWPTPDLSRYGWNLGGFPPIHLLPAGVEQPAPPPALRIERVTTAEQLQVLDRIAIDAFPFEDLHGAPPFAFIGPAILERPELHAWIGYDGDTAAGISIAWVAEGINQVALVATLPGFRGRGYGAALTWLAAKADPALPSMLMSSDDGRPVYDKMGYLPLHRWQLWWRRR